MKWLLFISLCLIWGSSFILIAEGLETMSPYQVASIRIFFAGLCFLPLIKKAYKQTPKEALGPIILSGFLGTFFPAFFFCIAQTKIDSSLAGILNALTPVFTIAIGTFFFHLKIGWLKWLGIFIGFTGMLITNLGGSNGINFDHLTYSLFVLLATIFYGLNVNVVNKYVQNVAPLHIATIAFTSLIIPTLIVLGATGYFTHPNLMNGSWTKGTLIAGLLGLINTGVASVIFYQLMKKAGPVFASTVTYIIPFVALGWGIYFGETITSLQLIGMVVILAGVRLANK
ncbi:MAG: DMT family transporter [Chitinophagaceae bacterium]|jgi:drug/metabolite transporter (DMT)-like permease